MNAQDERAEIDIAARFNELAAVWHQETDDLASSLRAISHPNYLRIISFGSCVLPGLLEDLRDNGGLWFPALTAITGIRLGTEQDRKSYKRMRELWLHWGAEAELL